MFSQKREKINKRNGHFPKRTFAGHIPMPAQWARAELDQIPCSLHFRHPPSILLKLLI